MTLRIVILAVAACLFFFGRWQINRRDTDPVTQMFGCLYIGGAVVLLIATIAAWSELGMRAF